MKKKSFLIASVVSLTALALGAVVFASNPQNKFELTYGNDAPFELNLNRSITSSEISAGQVSFNTAKGNPIVFKLDSSKASADSGLVSLATGGYFYNETPITGITKVEAILTSGSATLSYGNAIDALYVGSASLSGTSLITVNFAEPSDFFRIDNVTGPLAIASLKIAYSCSNDYQYAYDLENASGDLFYTAAYSSSSFGTATYGLDKNCLDVVNGNSGFSYHITTSESANGWPTFILVLDAPVDMTSGEVHVSAKGINHTAVNFMLLDAAGENVLNGNQTLTINNSWKSFVCNNFTAASGKDLTAVKQIRFSFNFSNSGTVREVFLDELHILVPENVTRYNLETGAFTRASTTQTPAVSLCTDTYGNSSTVSRKLDYATATGFPAGSPGSTYRAFATFNVEGSLGANNGVDFKNSTFSMDIKFSSALVNAEDARKNTFTLEVTDGAGATASIAASNFTFTMAEGWIHVAKDLSTVSGLSGLNGHAKNFRFGFYGVYGGNQAEAVIIIDNLALIPNETPSRNNLEMCPNIDTNAAQTAIGTPVFDDVAGGTSTASKKLTYAHAAGFSGNAAGTFRAFATFDVASALGASNGIDAKNCTLSFDVKFSSELVSSPDANTKYITLDITDSDGVTKSVGASASGIVITMTSGWIHVSKDLSTISAFSTLNGNTAKLRFGFYGVYTGNQATAYVMLDNVALLAPETPTRNNLEMCPNINTTANQTAIGTTVFDDVTGSTSTSAKKLTYAHAAGFNASASSTYRAFAVFDVASALGASNGIDVKACILSLDLKFSDELVNSEDTRKGSMTVEITDGANTTCSLFQVNFTMAEGWIHASRDLTDVTQVSSLSGDTAVIKLGFYGVYSGNQASAYIIVDNMALTVK